MPSRTPLPNRNERSVSCKPLREKVYKGNTSRALGLGDRPSHYQYTVDTEVNRYVSIRSSCCTDTSGSIISLLTFIQLSKRLKHIECDLIVLN